MKLFAGLEFLITYSNLMTAICECLGIEQTCNDFSPFYITFSHSPTVPVDAVMGTKECTLQLWIPTCYNDILVLLVKHKDLEGK